MITVKVLIKNGVALISSGKFVSIQTVDGAVDFDGDAEFKRYDGEQAIFKLQIKLCLRVALTTPLKNVIAHAEATEKVNSLYII